MKRFILAAIVLLSTVCMQAQQRREFTPESMATRQATQIKEACNVSEEQYDALYKLFLDQATKMRTQMDSLRAAGGNNGGFPQFNREDWQKRQDETTAKIKSILTAEQIPAYEEMVKKQRERRGGGFGGPRNN